MAMGLHKSGGKRRMRAPMAEINVTPFVDVMLVLLIIFMVTAPLLNSGVPLDLPDSRAKALSQEADQLEISMTRDGRLYFDNSELAPGELPDRLVQAIGAAGGTPPPVTLRADRSLDYGRVMAVMGELNRAGFTAISLVNNSSSELP
ncbi:ExbD/TolR family protein [Pseudoblastomonas halimionae]|uniref:Protein TolR n=1 Tax=Alteriqipengyuania halimionae TaxID=1926630 RepID=A0A6I4TY86_9SPHN|nr:ExbD/TolR family protein [Alteriqipengyuania halimionae]MXP08610.1 protein TolR [Alteriqipengyuania halimionae]